MHVIIECQQEMQTGMVKPEIDYRVITIVQPNRLLSRAQNETKLTSDTLPEAR